MFIDIEKKHGPGSLIRLGDEPASVSEVLPTGIAALDQKLGIGGLRVGQPVELFGAEASGKTTLALHIIASAQQRGGVCAFIDAEHALDLVYAGRIGVDVDNLLMSQPDSAEEALDIAVALASSGEIAVFVVDSIAALVPRAEIEGDMGDAHMGLQPRLMGQAMRKLKSILNNTGTIGVFINQTRMAIGVYGSPEVTPGGRAMKFAAGVRMKITRTESLKSGGEIIGTKVKVQMVKNKWASPFQTAEFDIIYGEGVSVIGSLIDEAVGQEIVKKSGAWLYFGEEKLGQGREAARQFLVDNPDVYATLTQQVQDVTAA